MCFRSIITVSCFYFCISVSKAELEVPYSTYFDEVYPPDSDPDTTPLYFGLVIGKESVVENSDSLVSAVKLSLDAVNNHPNLLRGYSLHYTLTYTNVSTVYNIIMLYSNNYVVIMFTCNMSINFGKCIYMHACNVCYSYIQ